MESLSSSSSSSSLLSNTLQDLRRLLLFAEAMSAAETRERLVYRQKCTRSTIFSVAMVAADKSVSTL
jgi:hypothetical protein